MAATLLLTRVSAAYTPVVVERPECGCVTKLDGVEVLEPEKTR